jgi:hypothetical protein
MAASKFMCEFCLLPLTLLMLQSNKPRINNALQTMTKTTTLKTAMTTWTAPSSTSLSTSIAAAADKLPGNERSRPTAPHKRQITVLKLEMDSIRQTIARGTGGGLFARLDGRLSAEEQLAMYTARMETL